MRKQQKPNIVYLPMQDYGDDWLNRLAAILMLIGKMGDREREASLEFIVSKYLKVQR